VGVDPHNEQHQFGATVGGRSSASKTFLFCGYDQHIFNVRRVVEFLNGSMTVAPAAGHLPEYLDYEVWQSGDWRFGVRSGHCAGMPACQRRWAALCCSNALAGGGATFTEWRDETRAIVGERRDRKGSTSTLGASVSFGCG